jgi:glutathione S-transferase
MNTQRILYGSVVSPFVRKVWIVLRLKNLVFEINAMIPFFDDHKEALLKMSPLGKVPIYRENGLIIADSSVICAYLEKKHPPTPVYPSEPHDYAQCLWYEEYADTVLIPTILNVFFNKVLAAKFGQRPDEEAVQHALEIRLPEIFNYLEQHVNNKQYLVGNAFSLADISITAPFINLELAGHAIDCARWPALKHYVDAVSKESFVKEAIIQVRERIQE